MGTYNVFRQCFDSGQKGEFGKMTKPHKKLIKLRADKTQKEVAVALGISRSYLANIEVGKKPSLSIALALSAYYKVPIKNLFPQVYEKYRQIFLSTDVPLGDNDTKSKAV